MNLQLMLRDSITHDYKGGGKERSSTQTVDTGDPNAMKKALKDLGI